MKHFNINTSIKDGSNTQSMNLYLSSLGDLLFNELCLHSVLRREDCSKAEHCIDDNVRTISSVAFTNVVRVIKSTSSCRWPNCGSSAFKDNFLS